MASKIAAFLMTFLISLISGTVLFFGLIVAMNGLHESDATYGIVAYLVLTGTAVLLLSCAAAFVAHLLIKRGFSGLVSALIAIAVFSIIAFVSEAVSVGIGVAIADYVRINY